MSSRKNRRKVEKGKRKAIDEWRKGLSKEVKRFYLTRGLKFWITDW
jgi:hypothetical protein